MSSVAIATLKPSPGPPSRFVERHATAGEAKGGERMRSDNIDAAGDLETRRIGVDDEA